MKPTYGAVSRAGVFPLAFSLDHVGVLSRNVQDNALVLEALLGCDRADPSSVEHPAAKLSVSLNDGIKGLRIGVIDEFGAQANPEVLSAFGQACRVFEQLGDRKSTRLNSSH